MCKFRLDGSRLLNLLRGKRLVFVGDSLNRNMWESLICILRNSVQNKSKVYEANGRVQFRGGEASYSFVFEVSILEHLFSLPEMEIKVSCLDHIFTPLTTFIFCFVPSCRIIASP